MKKYSMPEQRPSYNRPHSISSISSNNNNFGRIEHPRYLTQTENIFSSLKFPNSQSNMNVGSQITPKKSMVSSSNPYYEIRRMNPATKKISFTFIHPDDLKIQKKEIETHVR